MNLFTLGFAAIALSSTLLGCASIHIHNKDGAVKTTQGFGIVDISIPDGNPDVLVDAKGVGIIKIGSNFTIGYTQQKLAALSASCKVVFWIEDSAQSEKVVELLKSIGDSCILNDTISKQGETK